MNIPESVRIGGVDYKIKYEERLIDATTHVALLGQIDHDNAVIRIEPNLQDVQGMHRTLLHEIIHGIERLYRMEFSDDDVDRLACGLYMVIKDNPCMFSDKTPPQDVLFPQHFFTSELLFKESGCEE